MYKRIVCFQTVKSDKIKLTVLESKCEPLISNIGIYFAPPIIEPLEIKESGEIFFPTNKWIVMAPGVSELEWRKAIDKRDGTVFIIPDENGLIIDMLERNTFDGFSFMPIRNSKEGLIQAYEFSISSDGVNWEILSAGEFSNIENNPIRQTISTPKTTARFLKFKPTRLIEGEHGAIGDFKIFHTSE